MQNKILCNESYHLESNFYFTQNFIGLVKIDMQIMNLQAFVINTSLLLGEVFTKCIQIKNLKLTFVRIYVFYFNYRLVLIESELFI